MIDRFPSVGGSEQSYQRPATANLDNNVEITRSFYQVTRDALALDKISF